MSGANSIYSGRESSPQQQRENRKRLYEAEVIPGLESVAMDELLGRFPAHVHRLSRTRGGFFRFEFKGRPALLNSLRSVIALYRVNAFDIPRPKALLGHQHFTAMLRELNAISHDFPRRPRSLGIGAAGSRSSVLRRLQHELSRSLGLEAASDKGELYIRIVRNRDTSNWEVLARTTMLPISKRDYRIHDEPGSLNSTVAYAMTQLVPARAGRTVLNLCSGSSTIAIEHALQNPADYQVAIDSNPAVIAAGQRNAAASGMEARIQHLLADATLAPLPSAVAGLLYADLPFGARVGTHAENRLLYPAILAEAARLARPGAAFVVLTHEISLMRKCLSTSSWIAAGETRINLRGIHPRLFVLRRNSARI